MIDGSMIYGSSLACGVIAFALFLTLNANTTFAFLNMLLAFVFFGIAGLIHDEVLA